MQYLNISNRLLCGFMYSIPLAVLSPSIAVGYTFNVTLSVMQAYNDNLFFVDEDRLLEEDGEQVAGENGETAETETPFDPREPELADYITTTSPGFQFGYATSRIESMLTVRYDFLQYTEYSDLDDIDQDYAGSIDYELTEYTRLDLDASYKRDSSPDRDFESTGLVLGTAIRGRQDYGVAVEHDLSEKSMLLMGYNYAQDDFSTSSLDNKLVELDEAITAEDEDIELTAGDNGELEPSYAEQLRASRKAVDSKIHSASLSYSRDIGDWFDNSFVFSTARYLHYETSQSIQNNLTMVLGGGAELTETISFRVDGGLQYTHEDYDYQQLKLLVERPFYDQVEVMRTQEEWGPVVHAQLDYQGEWTAASFKFGYDVQPASGKGTLTERTEFRLDLARRMGEHFKARGYATYFMNNRDGVEQLLPLVDEGALAVHNDLPPLKDRLEEEGKPLYGVDEKSLTLGVELNYEVNEYFNLVGQYSYTMLEKELTNSDARRNRVFLRLDFKYPLYE